ncbi:putative xyloglucan glycosyltransferase 12 [Hibiscus syriacus]|uniref:Xyloglucan glycosyltransferase 12 n=1 Tax=Hibiscus syriacus TaxID=106335 RepID=A0A6A2ZV78_HIBSY|nr:putative xyloglucan glycosyltransferase 12 [Hibiscus syriacus]
MILFIQANDLDAWEMIESGYSFSKKKEKNWSDQERKKAQQNAKAMHMVFCAFGHEIYEGVSSCSSAKELWNKLEEIHGNKKEEPTKVVSLLANEDPKDMAYDPAPSQEGRNESPVSLDGDIGDEFVIESFDRGVLEGVEIDGDTFFNNLVGYMNYKTTLLALTENINIGGPSPEVNTVAPNSVHPKPEWTAGGIALLIGKHSERTHRENFRKHFLKRLDEPDSEIVQLVSSVQSCKSVQYPRGRVEDTYHHDHVPCRAGRTAAAVRESPPCSLSLNKEVECQALNIILNSVSNTIYIQLGKDQVRPFMVQHYIEYDLPYLCKDHQPYDHKDFKCLAFFGVVHFGDHNMDDVLAKFDDDLGIPYSLLLDDLVKVSYGLHLMLVFPIVFFSLRLNVDGLLFPYAIPIAFDDRRFFSVTVALMGFILMGAICVPCIWDAFQFTGATATVCVGFIFPAVISLRDTHGIATKNDKLISWIMIFLAVSTSTVAPETPSDKGNQSGFLSFGLLSSELT